MGLFLDAIAIAKNLFSYEKDIIGKIESAVHPASQELKILIGRKEYCRLFNSQIQPTIVSVAETTDGKSELFLSELNITKLDDIQITGTDFYDGCFCSFIINESAKSVVIDRQFKGTKTGFIGNELFTAYKMAFAWLICYYVTFAVQEIKKDKVLITSEEFGEGNIKTFSISDIIKQREDFLRNAHIIVGAVDTRRS